jgi:hypothetical protein
MKRQKMSTLAALVTLTIIGSMDAHAGPYADDMAKCLVKSSAAADRTAFIKWMFAAIALHPDAQSMANITSQQREELNKAAGTLFQRLLLESCRSETQQAIRFEGPQTIAYAFQIFGQAAARELITNPSVAGAMSGLNKYLDEEKLKALTNPADAK